MQNLLRNTLLTFALAAFVISPVFADAKSSQSKAEKAQAKIERKLEKEAEKVAKKTEQEAKKAEKKAASNKKSCVRAWGHLIARGWLKHNSAVEFEIGENCFIPFGIAKKFGGFASTTPDTTAPVMTNIAATPTQTRVVVTWTTNEKADSTLYISTTSPVNISSASTIVKSDNDKELSHELTVNNLVSSTTYYAIVRSTDKSGNTATSSQFSFTTASAPVVVDNTSPVISSIITTVSSSSAHVLWLTNEAANSKVFYSTTSPVNVSATTTAFVSSSALVNIHSIPLTNLATSTTYFVVVQSADASLNTSTSSQFSITTTP